MLSTQIAFVLLIAFVANPLLDQLYSFFSVSEHPMQAGSTVQSLKNFFCLSCVCVRVGGVWLLRKIKTNNKHKVVLPVSVA